MQMTIIKVRWEALMGNKLNERYTFDKFIVGDNNRFAHDVSMAVAKDPGKLYNPLYLYAAAGLGKTHLMQSTATYVLENQPGMRVMYIDASAFTEELITSIKASRTDPNAMPAFKRKYRREVDILLVDDIQFLMGKKATQEEFLNMFNELYMMGKQIVLSSDVPPQELETLDDRLGTRFGMGVVANISMPTYETRMRILESKQENSEIKITKEPLNFIAQNIKNNVRQLEGALNKLLAYERMKREFGDDIEEIDLNELLKDYITVEPLNLTPDNILDRVSEYYHLTVKEIKGASRSAQIVFARHVCMFLMYNLIDNITLQQIGDELGGRNHATIMHGIKKIYGLAGADTELLDSIYDLQKEIEKMETAEI